MKRTHLTLVVLATLTLAGCASAPDKDPLTGGYGTCTKATIRDAGMGVTVPSCSEWVFGPSRSQTAAFERRPLFDAPQK